MDEFIRGSSSYARLRTHLCLKVKYSHKVFDNKGLRIRCKKVLTEIARDIGTPITEIGFDSNHVHMTVQLKASQSLSQVVKVFKGRSAKQLLREFPEVKRKFFWGSGMWSRAVFGDSIGTNADILHEYVRNQRYGESHENDFSLTSFI